MLKYINFLKRLSLNLLSPSRSVISKDEYIKIARLIKNSKNILNVGSGSNTVLGEKFWTLIDKNSSNIINLDIVPGENVDVVSSAEEIPFEGGQFDLVVCQAVLEHVENPQKVIFEIKRVLKTEGILYCTVPFLQGYHPDPNDFQRYTIQGMEKLLFSFNILQRGVSSGPFSSLSWIIRDILTIGGKGSFIYLGTRFISSIISLPISLLDYLFPKTNSYIRNASEYYYLAKAKK